MTTTDYDPEFDTIKTQTVRGWKIECNHYKTGINWSNVYIYGPRHEEAHINSDGDFVYEVHDDEKGRGYHSGYAQDRSVPAEVVVAAFTMWRIYMDPKHRDGV